MDARLRFLQIGIGSAGVLGNSVVCAVIGRVPAMRTVTNAFIFNQALADFLGSLFMILYTEVKAPAVLHSNTVVATAQCYIWHSKVILWVLYTTSTLNLVALTLERYVAIVFPFKYVTYFGRKQATVLLSAVWLLAVGYKVTNSLYYQIVDRACVYAHLTAVASMVWGVVAFLVEYLMPLIFMTACYVHIAVKLKKASMLVHTRPASAQRGECVSGSLLRARRNTLKTLFTVFVTYAICWSPNQIAFLMFNFGFLPEMSGTFYFFSVALVQLNCCINPIIYAFKYKQFQTGVRVVLKPCCQRLTPSHKNELPTVARSHNDRA
ncbi:allatostatin-A receptor-like [Acanthaster planci]|uniref:Allatostatin-A receptor-like n=1 Tax=Acanthaster planci TaxID=133434 RepID=A0A8B7Z776_ACAPL|nr:allatostatin-A receptor-like [Acanthaster planci]